MYMKLPLLCTVAQVVCTCKPLIYFAFHQQMTRQAASITLWHTAKWSGSAMQVVCKCKPSLFAYPPPVTQEAAAAAAKVPTAVLSTTARARDKAKKKEKKKAEASPAPPATAPGAHAGCAPTRIVRC